MHVHKVHRGDDNYRHCSDEAHWFSLDGCCLATCPAFQRQPVGLGNRPVTTPVSTGQPLRWQNVDHGVVRTMRLNTGYRYPGTAWEGIMTDSSLGD